MNKEDVKLKLIEVGARALQDKGYHAVGLKEILTDAQVPKGSFYYYFESKEDFCREIVSHYSQQYAEKHLTVLFNNNLPAKERLLTFFTQEREYYLDQQCRQSCLLAKLTLEMSRLSQPIRVELKRCVDGWIKAVASCLKEGIDAGEFQLPMSAEDQAELIYSAWTGAVTRMQVSQSVQPLDIFITYITKELSN